MTAMFATTFRGMSCDDHRVGFRFAMRMHSSLRMPVVIDKRFSGHLAVDVLLRETTTNRQPNRLRVLLLYDLLDALARQDIARKVLEHVS